MVDHFQQPPPRVVIFQVSLEMIRKLIDPLGKNGDLDFRRTRIIIVGSVGLNNLSLLFRRDGHDSVPLPFELPCNPGIWRSLGNSRYAHPSAAPGTDLGPRMASKPLMPTSCIIKDSEAGQTLKNLGIGLSTESWHVKRLEEDDLQINLHLQLAEKALGIYCIAAPFWGFGRRATFSEAVNFRR